jgi:hypothetical protein
LSSQDLRSWIAKMESAGEIQHISGADREERSAARISTSARPTVTLFDDRPGLSRTPRAANILTSTGTSI